MTSLQWRFLTQRYLCLVVACVSPGCIASSAPARLEWYYHKVSNIRLTVCQNLNVSRLGLQLSLRNMLKPSVKWRMKMQLEQRRHLSDQQFYCLLKCALYERLDGRLVCQHIETKRPTFCRRQFQCSLVWISLSVESDFIEIHGWGSSWQYSSIGSDNALTPNRQAIIWNNVGLVHWRVYA